MGVDYVDHLIVITVKVIIIIDTNLKVEDVVRCTDKFNNKIETLDQN